MKAYRNEIDGMRALAVVSVILFHTGFSFCPGGYVGVDVFFVISGYLITSIILAEHEQGTFSLIHFYERRARRILPALFVVLFCSVPFAYSYLPFDQLSNFAQALISITLCSSNFFFWMKEDYFNTETELNPLVHTWSLAIEEQFYILFSLLFVIFRQSQHRLIQYLLVLVSVVSLVLAQWSGNLHLSYPFIARDPLWFWQRDWSSFYLLTGRMWELLFGSLTAFYLHTHTLESRLWREVGAVLGLVLILIAIFQFDKDTPFPSFYTLVPTGGSVLVILCADQSTWPGRVLSVKVLTMIGLCSYSAYLWHQPLLAFAKMSLIERSLSLEVRVAVVVVSLALAYGSWRFVEVPFRNKALFTRKQIFALALVSGFLMNVIAVVLLRTSGTGVTFDSAQASKYKVTNKSSGDYLLDVATSRTMKYTDSRFGVLTKVKSYNKSSTLKRLAIIGDSHARDFVNMAVENKKLANYQIRTYSILWYCQMYIGEEDRLSFIPDEKKAQCRNAPGLQEAKPLIEESDVVILAALWYMWAAKRINVTVTNLHLRKNQTLIVVGTKAFSKANPTLYREMSYVQRQKLRWKTSAEYVAVNGVLAQQLSPSIFVDIEHHICGPDHSCPVFTPEDRLYSIDGTHTMESGARFVGAEIFKYPPLNKL